jgi:transposase
MEPTMEIATNELRTYAMDHHGLIASICKDLQVAEKIDKRIGKKDPRRIVSTGMAAVAMILNGLGFTNRRLYLTPQFFASKPVAQLFGKEVSANQFDDNALGKALDEISNYGSSQMFGEIAFEIALENNLLGELAHLDSTSMSVEGKYDDYTEEHVVKLTHGHSKDHRPDLKQVVMSLVVTGKSSMPLWMEPQNGNSSDKVAFHETIKKVRAFQKQLKSCPDFKWVADSALYSKDKLLKQNDYLWLSRVPETVAEARQLVETLDCAIPWVVREKGYKTANFSSNYGDISQRWLLVYSQQSYDREKKTFERKLSRQDESLQKLLWHLSNEKFSCDEDAMKAVKKIEKQFPYHSIKVTVQPVVKYGKSGRPKKDATADRVLYQMQYEIKHNNAAIEAMLSRKGRFILATNDLDDKKFPDEKMLSEYKEQQSIERGFRFLKDPWFMVDSIFLKSPSRIEALMMIMTLCLMIYNVGQYRLRCALKEKNETLPNQINKAVQNPTLRWIFQIMEGISVVHFFEKNISNPIKMFIANLNDLRIKIITLFGESAQKIYGIT